MTATAQEIAQAIRDEQDRAERAPGVTRGTREINAWLHSDEAQSVVKRQTVTATGGRTEPMPADNRTMGDFLRRRRGRMSTPGAARNATRR
jgi:hypothetical protein